VLAHQSVSSTGAVWPLNNGICSGKRPFSLSGITANAPPPLASQLTARYSGLTYGLVSSPSHISELDSGFLYLHQVGIPGIATDVQIIVGRFLSCWLSEDMSLNEMSMSACRVLECWRRRGVELGSLRYFDARTKRPAICAHLLENTNIQVAGLVGSISRCRGEDRRAVPGILGYDYLGS
jgi:hypothetical protein